MQGRMWIEDGQISWPEHFTEVLQIANDGVIDPFHQADLVERRKGALTTLPPHCDPAGKASEQKERQFLAQERPKRGRLRAGGSGIVGQVPAAERPDVQ